MYIHIKYKLPKLLSTNFPSTCCLVNVKSKSVTICQTFVNSYSCMYSMCFKSVIKKNNSVNVPANDLLHPAV